MINFTINQERTEARLSITPDPENPEKVYLANRIDGVFITPMDIRNIMRVIRGKGV